jgi:hypothetical protein
MDEMVQVLNEILSELQDMNRKLDDIRGCGFCSLDDIGDKLDAISTGVSWTENVVDHLDSMSCSGLYGINDICDKLDSVENAIEMK